MKFGERGKTRGYSKLLKETKRENAQSSHFPIFHVPFECHNYFWVAGRCPVKKVTKPSGNDRSISPETVTNDLSVSCLESRSLIRYSQHGIRNESSCVSNLRLLIFCDFLVWNFSQTIFFFLSFHKGLVKFHCIKLVYKLKRRGVEGKGTQMVGKLFCYLCFCSWAPSFPGERKKNKTAKRMALNGAV